jgi:hypothetical protein
MALRAVCCLFAALRASFHIRRCSGFDYSSTYRLFLHGAGGFGSVLVRGQAGCRVADDVVLSACRYPLAAAPSANGWRHFLQPTACAGDRVQAATCWHFLVPFLLPTVGWDLLRVRCLFSLLGW